MTTAMLIDWPLTQAVGSTGVGVVTAVVLASFLQDVARANAKMPVMAIRVIFFIVLLSEKITPDFYVLCGYIEALTGFYSLKPIDVNEA
jgi:hypothetical protein